MIERIRPSRQQPGNDLRDALDRAVGPNPVNSTVEHFSKRALADWLGVNRWSIDRWRRTDPDFPPPIWFSPTTPRWNRADVERWISTRERGGKAPSWVAKISGRRGGGDAR